MFLTAGHQLARRDTITLPDWRAAADVARGSAGLRGGASFAGVRTMSAIQSLLRVMMLRDAEAMSLEAGKAPSLRRRGLVEVLQMAPIEAQMIEDFIAPLL